MTILAIAILALLMCIAYEGLQILRWAKTIEKEFESISADLNFMRGKSAAGGALNPDGEAKADDEAKKRAEETERMYSEGIANILNYDYTKKRDE